MNDSMSEDAIHSGPVPRYIEIYNKLRSKIVSGDWPAGHKLASEPELAQFFGCARMTIGKALGALVEQHLIIRRRRLGTTVCSPRSQEMVLEIHDIETEIAATGRPYAYKCLARRTRRARPEDALNLDVPVGTEVLSLIGLHCASGQPHALEERLINLEAAPDAGRERFARISPGRWLLTRIPWTEAEHQISALSAGATVARRLLVNPGTACLCIERKTWLNGRRITHVRMIYPWSQHRLVARFRYRHP